MTRRVSVRVTIYQTGSDPSWAETCRAVLFLPDDLLHSKCFYVLASSKLRVDVRLCFTQAVSQTSTVAPSSSKARLEELVMRQSKQLIPVVASSSSRDKAKGKGTAASGPKHGPLAAPGTGSGTGTAMGRSKAGIDGTKRGEEAPSGTHMKGSCAAPSNSNAASSCKTECQHTGSWPNQTFQWPCNLVW